MYVTKTTAKKMIDDWYKQIYPCRELEPTDRPCTKCEFSKSAYFLIEERMELVPICSLFQRAFIK